MKGREEKESLNDSKRRGWRKKGREEGRKGKAETKRKGFPSVGWKGRERSFPTASFTVLCVHRRWPRRERYIPTSSRPYFWETRLSVYSQLRSRVGNALCCSSKVKGESEAGRREGMEKEKEKWSGAREEDGLIKWNVLGNSILSSLHNEDRRWWVFSRRGIFIYV